MSTPITDALRDKYSGDPSCGDYHDELEKTHSDLERQLARVTEQRDQRFTIEEIADYLAGWTLGSFDEVAKLGAHVAHNALNQLRDDQDGIMAVRIRKELQSTTH